jgi:hypothetical protein
MTALFRSAHEALMFAFTFSDACGHPVAAAAERTIAAFARDRYGRETGSGRGLVGLDGAAQAGMIRAHVERMHPLHQVVIVARFSVTDTAQRQRACSALAIRARHAVPCDLAATVLLLRKLHGLRVDTGRIADERDVCERTVRGWQLSVKRWLELQRTRAMDEAERRLTEAGIVEAAS